ncbi:MAG TPA: hypothetical protein PKL31_06750 [Fulvivirga sp.]|nr:hypothetical protein [Fulvivirga sp.]
MVEVFVSDVNSTVKAKEIVALLHKHFNGYQVNFDLDDCDNILRVMSVNTINTKSLIDFLACHDVKIEPLN